MSIPVQLGFYPDELQGRWRRLSYKGEKSLILCAPPGSGKQTRSVAINALTWPGSLVVYDPKGEGVAIAGRFRQRWGPVHVIDPFGVLHDLRYPSGQSVAEALGIAPARFNALADLKPQSPRFSGAVGTIAESLIIPATMQRFFTDGARQLVQGIVEHEVMTNPAASLVDVYRALWLPYNQFAEYMLKAAAQSPSDNARAVAGIYADVKAPRSAGEVWSDAKTQLATFMQAGCIRDFLRSSSFRWQSLKEQTATVFIVMPEQEAKTYSRFTRLLFASAFNALLAPPRGDVLFIMDEIATSLGGAGLEIVNTVFTLGRGYGLRIQAVLQSWAQTRDIWDNQTETITAACGVRQFFAPRDAVTVAYIKDRAGNYTASYAAQSRSFNQGWNETGESGGMSETWSTHFAPMPHYWEQDLYEFGGKAPRNGPAPQILFLDGIGQAIEAATLPYYHPGQGLGGRYDANPFVPPLPLVPAKRRRG